MQTFFWFVARLFGWLTRYWLAGVLLAGWLAGWVDQLGGRDGGWVADWVALWLAVRLAGWQVETSDRLVTWYTDRLAD